MRITAEQKANTRRRILDVSQRLFRSHGYAATTTRDIAMETQIATGTLFNYFPTKEAIVSSLVEAALERARSIGKQTQADSLEEELFGCIAAELRQLKPHRKYVAVWLETAMNPLVTTLPSESSDVLRVQHLEMVTARVRQRGLGELSPLAIQLYWTLYVGVIAFWSADKSPKQEDTLALLDQSLAMFASWLRSEANASD